MSVAEIFRGEGESSFRAAEAAALEKALAGPERVIACGGGVVLDDRNLEALRGRAFVVYLEVDAQGAAARVGTADDRPLLAGGEVEKEIEKQLEARSQRYRGAADVVIDASGSPDEVTAKVIAEIG